MDVPAKDIPHTTYNHFLKSLRGVKPSVSASTLAFYKEWNDTYGYTNESDSDDNGRDESESDQS